MSIITFNRGLLLAGAALMLTTPAVAQDHDAASDASAPFTLGEIIVTAGGLDRLPQPSAISRIDSSTLEALDKVRVSDALDILPGVHLNPGNRGGSRNERGVFLRGFDQSRVPLLVDGIPVYVPYDGYVDLDRLLTGDLARIEVTKGYAPVTVGPNALGGAINLVTRRPTRAIEGNAVASATLNDNGGWQGWRAAAGIGTAQDGWYAQANVAWIDTDKTRLPDGYGPGLYQPRGDRVQSGTEDLRVSGKIALTPGDDEYALGVVLVRGEKGAPPYAGNDASRATFFDWPRYDKTSAYLSTSTSLGGDSRLRVRAYYDSFRNQIRRYDDARYATQFRPYAFTSDYDDHTLGGTVELTTALGAGNATTVAVHGKKDVHREFGPAGPRYRMADFTFSAGVETRQSIGDALTLAAGASYERRDALSADNPGTGGTFATQDQNALNLQGGLTYAIDPRNNVHLSVARRTRFALMYERYSYRLGNGLPNPDLKPEQAINYEIGWVGQPSDGVKLTATLFASDVTNYIQQVTVGLSPTPPYGTIAQAQNAGKAWFYGAEAGIEARPVTGILFAANYTYLRRDGRNGTPDAVFYGTPRHKLSVWAEIAATDRLSLVPNLALQSRQRTIDTGNGRPVDGFALVGFKAAWRLLSATSVELSASNLFDARAEYDDGYPVGGRAFTASIRTRF